MNRKQLEKIVMRNIAWAALEGFRRDHQGAQGIIGDDLIGKISSRKEAEQIVEFTIATLRKLGVDDNPELLTVRYQEYEHLKDMEWGN